MASMTYLQLAQYAHRLLKSGNAQAGSLPASIPILVANSDQVVLDIVDAIPRAWEWVQNEHVSWTFMRKQGSFNLTSGTRTYSLATIQAQISDYYGFIPFWACSPGSYYFLCDPAQTPQVLDYPFRFVEYQDFRGLFDRRPRPANFQPTVLTERPDKTIEVDPAPNLAPSGGQWQIRFDYRIKNQVLALGSDVPILPPEFHELIAWVAVRMVCEIRMDNSLKYQSALVEIDKYMGRLKSRYLPVVTVDASYA